MEGSRIGRSGRYPHKKQTASDGTVCDSVKECRRYEQLLAMQKAGEIVGLSTQVKFQLIPAKREPDIIGKRGGVKKGKVIENECYYKADFTYYKDGHFIVEDAKGVRTPEYIIKRKLMLHLYDIRIVET